MKISSFGKLQETQKYNAEEKAEFSGAAPERTETKKFSEDLALKGTPQNW